MDQLNEVERVKRVMQWTEDMARHHQRVSRLADFFGGYIDRPNDLGARGSVQDQKFFTQFDKLLPPSKFGYTPTDFGVLQEAPHYRGIRMVLPQSGFTYEDGVHSAGNALHNQGHPRIMSEGPPGPPNPGDPHYNNIPRYPSNYPPDRGALLQEFLGRMISRGYPVFGGTGDFGGEFPSGFNPIGFGQR